MFQWDKSITSLDLPAARVLHLFRSMRTVQMALPGVPSQEASAYLCQYKGTNGVVTTAAFHMHKTEQLAFYFADSREVPEAKADNAFDEAMNFIESMGFLIADMDLHLLNDEDRAMLWESLPLHKGPLKPDAKGAKGATAEAEEPKSTGKAPQASSQSSQPKVTAKIKVDEAVAAMLKDESSAASDESVDDLLAAVEAMRAKRPGLRARKAQPSPEEIERRRNQLRENVGRILASM